MRIGRLKIRNLIRVGLRRQIVRDLKQRRIASEADLQSCVYFHLRRFLTRDTRWTILNRAYVRDTLAFPDLVLRRRGRTRVVIELKEKRTLQPGWFKADVEVAGFVATWQSPSHRISPLFAEAAGEREDPAETSGIMAYTQPTKAHLSSRH